MLNAMTFDTFESEGDEVMRELNEIDPDLCYFNHFRSNTMNCNYYSEETFKHLLSSTSPTSLPFSILHSNIRSFYANINELLDTLRECNHDFSIICLSETWLGDSNCHSATITQYNHEFRIRSGKTGGGVSIYIQNHLKYTARSDLSELDNCIESIYVEIDKSSVGSDRNIVVGSIYRPPSSSIVEFTECLKSTMAKLSKENKYIYLTGDFNINLLEVGRNIHCSDFVETLFSHSMFPTINKPTRITSTSASIIDNIFINNIESQSVTSGILAASVSDHCPVFSLTPFGMMRRSTGDEAFVMKRIFNNNNKNRFNTLLADIDWRDAFGQSNCQAAFSSFYSEYKRCFDTCFPLIKVKLGYRDRKPWLSTGLKESIKKKNKLFRKFLKTKSKTDKNKYLDYKRMLRVLLRRAERDHYDDVFARCQGNLRKSWDAIRTIVGKRKGGDEPNISLHVNGKDVTSPKAVCDTFNNYFVNIGPSLARSIPPTNTDPATLIPHQNFNTLFIRPTNETEITNIIRELRSCAPGPDDIPASILKESSTHFIRILTHIINTSFQEGCFPHELKIAKIKPLFKSGEKNSVNNYRPISLLTAFSKIFEKCMVTRLIDFLTESNILYEYQFGFRPKHSTNMALHLLVDKISSSLGAGGAFVGVSLDFRKAFDTIDPKILLEKMYKYGVRGSAHQWFQSYLQERQQYVCMGTARSEYLTMCCGVPQGSILGPILFLIYINDLHQSTALFPIVFADDTNLFFNAPSVDECIAKINYEMANIVRWIRCNKLSLNIDKTNYIIFNRCRKPTAHPTIYIEGMTIKRVLSIKFLGVIIDDKLSWREHVDYIRGKISRSIGVLYRARPLLSQQSLIKLYYAFIYPYLNYCVDVWGHCSQGVFRSLFVMQKKAIRIISNSKRLDHTEPIFKSLKILPLLSIYILSILTFMFKHYHQLLPRVCYELFTANSSIHQIATRQQHLLHPPRLSSSFDKKSIRYRGAFYWNQISNIVVDINNISVHTFKNKLKFKLLFSPQMPFQVTSIQ